MEQLTTPVGMLLGVIAFVWSSTWFLSRQFTIMLDKIYLRIDNLQKNVLDKLEYHERHDDSRFESMRNNLWELRLQQTLNRKEKRDLENGKNNVEFRETK